MLTFASLCLPILVAAVGVFVASSLIHMVFRWHNADYRKLANQDEVRAALLQGQVTPGQYTLPHCLGPADMNSPDNRQRFVDGPVGFIVLRPAGLPKIGPHLLQWFLLTLAVAATSALIASAVLGRGAAPGAVFRFFAGVSFLAYAAGAVSDGIWKSQPWGAVSKDLLDALIYALVSGAVFAWLWPD
jgi:hypothetical protein